MDRPALYQCLPCGAASPAFVTASGSDDELVQSSIEHALNYATCPRCGERNPAGVAEHAASRRRGRVIGTLVSAVVAVAIWFVPWLAFVVLVFMFAMTVLASVVRARAKTLRVGEVAYSVAFSTVFLLVVLFYPRAAAIVPLVLAVRFAISGGENDSVWDRSKHTVRFEAPYR